DLAPVLRAEESPRDQLTPMQRQVLEGVRPRKILTAEQIAAAVGVSERDARRTLPELELAQFVTAQDGGYRLFRKSDADPRSQRARLRRATRTRTQQTRTQQTVTRQTRSQQTRTKQARRERSRSEQAPP